MAKRKYKKLKRGAIKTVRGIKYRLGKTSRWERVKDIGIMGSVSGGALLATKGIIDPIRRRLVGEAIVKPLRIRYSGRLQVTRSFQKKAMRAYRRIPLHRGLVRGYYRLSSPAEYPGYGKRALKKHRVMKEAIKKYKEVKGISDIAKVKYRTAQFKHAKLLTKALRRRTPMAVAGGLLIAGGISYGIYRKRKERKGMLEF
jgi:hypothetical protein